MNAEAGKIDDLSKMLGQLMEGQRALDRYTHDHAHDVGNLSGKIDGLNHSIRKQFEELESRINRRIEDTAAQLRSEGVSMAAQLAAANQRIVDLERAEQRRDGASRLFNAVTKSPVVGWVVGAGTALWAIVTGRLHL